MKVKITIFIAAILAMIFLPQGVLAHCPLCTIGAGAAAAGAAWLGVKYMVIGIFLGAFAVALGLWIGRMIKKSYIPHQTSLLGVLSFITTILPLRPLLKDYGSFYLSIAGDYGSFLNRTYLVDRFLLGSLIGALILVITPYISNLIIKTRGSKIFPYQGIIITFVLLLSTSLIIQFVL